VRAQTSSTRRSDRERDAQRRQKGGRQQRGARGELESRFPYAERHPAHHDASPTNLHASSCDLHTRREPNVAHPWIPRSSSSRELRWPMRRSVFWTMCSAMTSFCAVKVRRWEKPPRDYLGCGSPTALGNPRGPHAGVAGDITGHGNGGTCRPGMSAGAAQPASLGTPPADAATQRQRDAQAKLIRSLVAGQLRSDRAGMSSSALTSASSSCMALPQMQPRNVWRRSRIRVVSRTEPVT
jgi:hypothetical protein